MLRNIYTHIYTYILISTHICTYIHIHTYIYTPIGETILHEERAELFRSRNLPIVSQVEMPNCFSGTHICTYIHISTHIYTYKHIHTHIYTLIGKTILHEESAELFRRRNLPVCIAG